LNLNIERNITSYKSTIIRRDN